MSTEIFISKSERDTINYGKKFAERITPGDVIALYGELGAGKTEFVKGICQQLEIEQIVTSPTFTIMNCYTCTLNESEVSIYHIDLYRIKKVEELDEIGFDECIHSPDDIKLIEWAEKAENRLSKVNYKVSFALDEENEELRQIEITKV